MRCPRDGGPRGLFWIDPALSLTRGTEAVSPNCYGLTDAIKSEAARLGLRPLHGLMARSRKAPALAVA